MVLVSLLGSMSAFGLLGLVIPTPVAASDNNLAHRASSQPLPYKNASLPTTARVEDLLSRMTYLDKLAQTRASPYGLSANSTYNLSEIVEFNAPYGLGSICKYNHVLLQYPKLTFCT
jgi:hypothetical protein